VTPVPLNLPLRPSEAAEVANLVFELAERRPLTGEVRNRIAARAAALRLEGLTPLVGSLARDPVHHSTYYLVVDVAGGQTQLLHMAPASAPTSSVFHKPLLICRVRRAGGPEAVINAIPFGPSDAETLEKYVSRVDPAFSPRPHGQHAALVAAPARLETGMAAAFDAFRRILKRTGMNVAAVEMAPPAYDAGLRAAVRAGWRDGYSAGVTLRAGETGREAVREAARFTRFRIDAADLVVDADGAGAVEERYDAAFTAGERAWIAAEFVRRFDAGGVAFELTAADAARMAVRLGPALKACERLHEWIREARSAAKTGRSFDFELALPGASARELLFALHWLKARGHAAQFIDPGAMAEAELEAALLEFPIVGRHYGCVLAVQAGESHSDAALEALARATAGRVSYRVSGEAAGDARRLNRIAEILWG
jgi:hypothetical protein